MHDTLTKLELKEIYKKEKDIKVELKKLQTAKQDLYKAISTRKHYPEISLLEKVLVDFLSLKDLNEPVSQYLSDNNKTQQWYEDIKNYPLEYSLSRDVIKLIESYKDTWSYKKLVKETGLDTRALKKSKTTLSFLNKLKKSVRIMNKLKEHEERIQTLEEKSKATDEDILSLNLKVKMLEDKTDMKICPVVESKLLCEKGMPIKSIARVMNVSERTVRRWLAS